MDFQWILTWSLDCQKSLPVLVAVGVDEIPLLVLASCQSWDPMPVHRIRQHPSLQGTAHPLSLVALQHAGQCGAWRGDGNRCRICRRTTFRTEHCLYVYTKGAFPGVCDASSCYISAGFFTFTYCWVLTSLNKVLRSTWRRNVGSRSGTLPSTVSARADTRKGQDHVERDSNLWKVKASRPSRGWSGRKRLKFL